MAYHSPVCTISQGTVSNVDKVYQFREIVLKLNLVFNVGMVPDVIWTQVGVHRAPVPCNQDNAIFFYKLYHAGYVQFMIAGIAVKIIDYRIPFL